MGRAPALKWVPLTLPALPCKHKLHDIAIWAVLPGCLGNPCDKRCWAFLLSWHTALQGLGSISWRAWLRSAHDSLLSCVQSCVRSEVASPASCEVAQSLLMPVVEACVLR